MKKVTHCTVQRGWRLLIVDMRLNPADALKLAGLRADLFSRKDASRSPWDYFDPCHGLEQAAATEALPPRIGQAISVEGIANLAGHRVAPQLVRVHLARGGASLFE